MKSVFDCSFFISANVTGQVGSLAVCPCAADAMSLLGDSEHLWQEYFDLSCLKEQFLMHVAVSSTSISDLRLF